MNIVEVAIFQKNKRKNLVVFAAALILESLSAYSSGVEKTVPYDIVLSEKISLHFKTYFYR